MTEAPNYLVRTSDGVLHCYFTVFTLLWDLAFHRGEDLTIYELTKTGFKAQYHPTSEAMLRERLKQNKQDGSLRPACSSHVGGQPPEHRSVITVADSAHLEISQEAV